MPARHEVLQLLTHRFPVACSWKSRRMSSGESASSASDLTYRNHAPAQPWGVLPGKEAAAFEVNGVNHVELPENLPCTGAQQLAGNSKRTAARAPCSNRWSHFLVREQHTQPQRNLKVAACASTAPQMTSCKASPSPVSTSESACQHMFCPNPTASVRTQVRVLLIHWAMFSE